MTTNSGRPLTPVQISPVEDIVADLRAGRIVIMVDDEDRENEGDLLIASDHVTAEAINFMARYGRGLICLTLTRERCEHLKLPPMAASNGTVYSTAFTVSIEAAEGVTTGISAADRALTVKAAVAAHATAHDLVQPGHIFPLQAVDGGVLMRAGHTEAGCDLGTMAGCSPSSVICEIMKDDGTMARLPDLQIFAAEQASKLAPLPTSLNTAIAPSLWLKKSVRVCCKLHTANSLPTRSKTSQVNHCTWLWSKANGMLMPKCQFAFMSLCPYLMYWKLAAACIHGAWKTA
jgi:3,4-dihydroxy-2-butanone 4-phosphate synthase